MFVSESKISRVRTQVVEASKAVTISPEEALTWLISARVGVQQTAADIWVLAVLG